MAGLFPPSSRGYLISFRLRSDRQMKDQRPYRQTDLVDPSLAIVYHPFDLFGPFQHFRDHAHLALTTEDDLDIWFIQTRQQPFLAQGRVRRSDGHAQPRKRLREQLPVHARIGVDRCTWSGSNGRRGGEYLEVDQGRCDLGDKGVELAVRHGFRFGQCEAGCERWFSPIAAKWVGQTTTRDVLLPCLVFA